MQQRQPRLGDIVDDYCPRERRITNHAIVAMINHEIRQTRCVTCDAEHDYRHAKVPPQRKKKEASGALYQEVLAGMPRKPLAAAVDHADVDAAPAGSEPPAAPDPVAAAAADADVSAALPEPSDDEGPVHRPLIRATLPRHEGQPPARPVPEFTMRQNNHHRAGRFRPRAGDQRSHPVRFGSDRPDRQHSGQQHAGNRGNRPQRPARHPGGTGGPRPGKKRSR